MALVLPYLGTTPRIGTGVFLAATCSVVGDIEIGDDSNIWYGCVLRGDVGKIRIGKRVNVQDLTCIHMTENLSASIIEDEVSIGHSVVIHGAIIEGGVLVGMGSVVMDNAHIGQEAIIGAGSLVTGNTKIPPRTLAVGRPARVVRELSADEIRAGRATATKYVKLGQVHARVQPSLPEPR
jgi:carbonic anhydrase/acetyltransferase-like protein (isoleucine patch superfamily)